MPPHDAELNSVIMSCGRRDEVFAFTMSIPGCSQAERLTTIRLLPKHSTKSNVKLTIWVLHVVRDLVLVAAKTVVLRVVLKTNGSQISLEIVAPCRTLTRYISGHHQMR